MREALFAVAIIAIICLGGRGLEDMRTADRLEQILKTDVSVVHLWMLGEGEALVERLEEHAARHAKQLARMQPPADQTEVETTLAGVEP